MATTPHLPSPSTDADARYRATLFCDLPLSELVAGLAPEKNPDPASPFTLFRHADQSRQSRKPALAAQILYQLLALPDLEPQTRLLAWTALRSLAQKPTGAAATQSRGVIFEVPIDGGLDTLAVYETACCRLIHHSAGITVWDVPNDPVIAPHAEKLLDAATRLYPDLPAATRHDPPGPDQWCFTILAYAGPRAAYLNYPPRNEPVANMILSHGAAILQRLADAKTAPKPAPKRKPTR